MPAPTRASMLTQQSAPAENSLIPNRRRGSARHRPPRHPSRPPPSTVVQRPGAPPVRGTADSPIVLDDSSPHCARNTTEERAAASSPRAPPSTPRRSVRNRTHVSSYNELDSPSTSFATFVAHGHVQSQITHKVPASTIGDFPARDITASSPSLVERSSPLDANRPRATAPPRRTLDFSALRTPHISPSHSAVNADIIQTPNRRPIARFSAPKGLTAAGAKSDLADMTPSDGEMRDIETARSSGTLQTGPPTSFSRFANNLSRQPSSFQSLEECLTQQGGSATVSRTPFTSQYSARPGQGPTAAPVQVLPTTSTHHHSTIPAISLHDFDDPDEEIHPSKNTVPMGNRAPHSTPAADGPPITRAPPILSVALERLDVQPSSSGDCMDVVTTVRQIKQESAPDTHESLLEDLEGDRVAIGGEKIAGLGKEGAMAVKVGTASREGANLSANFTNSAFTHNSSDIHNMSKHNKAQLSPIAEEEAEESAKGGELPEELAEASLEDAKAAHQLGSEANDATAKNPATDNFLGSSSNEIGRLRRRSPLNPSVYNPSRRLLGPTTKKPRKGKQDHIGSQTREFNRYLDTIPLPKDFYVREKEYSSPLSSKPGLLEPPTPVVRDECGPKAQDGDSGVHEVKSRAPRPNPNGPHNASLVRNELLGCYTDAIPMSPTALARTRKNKAAQRASGSDRLDTLRTTTGTPPASSSQNVANSRVQGDIRIGGSRALDDSTHDVGFRARGRINRMAEYLAEHGKDLPDNNNTEMANADRQTAEARHRRGSEEIEHSMPRPKRRRLANRGDNQRHEERAHNTDFNPAVNQLPTLDSLRLPTLSSFEPHPHPTEQLPTLASLRLPMPSSSNRRAQSADPRMEISETSTAAASLGPHAMHTPDRGDEH
ncbi:uncharacterized protein BKCO1_26000131 [Diplodia corticola]|uniref:Uncharacterized protein n=1 Tax=Diplodia corticola TaxID=236234 RepID=A0A1J9QXZ5_9PEZI|nr:uncharacterized protein BKCO1_26000131 [Diplodia corticola]OJD33910.1 hypothetical protein BKCO1_26000131 [Diplodia corticola]